MSKCSNCGTEISGQTKFCPNCGEKIPTPTQTIQLKCKACGGVLTTNEERIVLSCPYCGSKEMISESDNVTIERIKTKANKELEEMRMKNEIEKEARQEEKDYVETFKKGKFKKVLIVFSIIFGVFSLVSFIGGNIPSAIVALVQTILLIVSILMGMQVIKEKKRFFHILVAVVAFILIIPFFLFFGTSNQNEVEKINWEYLELHEQLPEPESDKGRIIYNTDDYLDIYVAKTSSDNYNDYLTACKEMGYDIESDYSTSQYSAFNDEGYKLSLWYNDDDKEMKISLDTPKEMTEINWPSAEPGCLLPTPKSLMGNEIINNSSEYSVDIANTTESDYKEYVSACEDAGFNIDYNKSEKSYSAYNEKGYHIYVNYESLSVMSISIYIPEEETTVKATEAPTKAPEKNEKPTEKATEAKVETTKGNSFSSNLDTPTLGELNALGSAKSYLNFMAFSYEGLIGQLEYDQYSHEEAVYAADNCGADWYEQAAKCAENYLNIMSFSRDSLIDQLVYEGFTYEQAVYGAEQNGY